MRQDRLSLLREVVVPLHGMVNNCPFFRPIDKESRRAICAVIRQLAGKTVIIVTHNMPDIEEGSNGVHLAKVQ